MPGLYDYTNATRTCEQLTKKMVDDVAAIVLMVRALEHTYSLANSSVSRAIDETCTPTPNTPSLPSFLLKRELSSLNLSLTTLKKTIRANIRESLRHLNAGVSCANRRLDDAADDCVQRSKSEYKQVLLNSIQILEKLEDELFHAEVCMMDVR